MKRSLPLLAVFLVAACAAPSPPGTTPGPTATAAVTSAPDNSPTPGPTATSVPSPSVETPTPQDGVAALLRDLLAAGVSVEVVSTFEGSPISTLGVQLCVAGDSVQVYVFGTAAEAQAQARMIDPTDPSNVGTSIITWMGDPRFWLRDRILVLYLGSDQAVEDALTAVLGQPFARGEGPPPLGGSDC